MAVEQEPALDREVDLEALDLDEVRAPLAGAVSLIRPRTCRLVAHSSAGTGLKQATKWSGSTSVSGGTFVADSSTA